jgi:preprotein translocase subunit YajC
MKLSILLTSLAQPLVAAQASAPSMADVIKQLAPILIIFAIFYFVAFAPMRRQRKQLQAVINDLKKGDKVITNGGLHGEVAAVEDGIVILRVADNVKLKVSKSAIAGLAPVPGDPSSSGADSGKGSKS